MTPEESETQLAEQLAERLSAMEAALLAGRANHDSTDVPIELQAQLDGGFQMLQRLNGLRLKRKTGDEIQPVATIGQRFGRFRIRQSIGQGGFGTVFLAFDERLNRDIALKIPHPESLVTPDLRERFRREAQATGSLEHHNLVAVYEAGEIGPICFLVSAYCSGGNLAQYIREQLKPLPITQIVEWTRQVGNGIQHAHERGILHRDLKPANVLLAESPQSAEGGESQERPHDLHSGTAANSTLPTLKITDFGLAKLIDGDLGLTKTGVMVGTPQYMAPEQTTGRESQVGPATDIYSLGVIMYEMMVGHPPFVAESALEMLQQVREVEPVPPRRLRSAIPRDLETICLKCLEKEPGRRYATAAALVEDLRRFSAHEPIAARPVGSTEKMFRWSRRHPLSAALMIALFLSVSGGMAAVLWQSHHAQKLAIQNGQERDRAEKNYLRAKAVVERLSQLGGAIAFRPGMDKTRQRVYEEILTYYRELLDERSDDPRVRLEAARAGHQLGRIRLNLGDHEQAEQAFQAAIQLYFELRAADPMSAILRAEHAESLKWHGHLLWRTVGRDQALAKYAEAITLLEQLHAEHGSLTKYAVAYANVLSNWAAHRQSIAPKESEQALLKAREVLRPNVESSSPDPSSLREYALVIDDLGLLYHAIGERAKSNDFFNDALNRRRDLIAADPRFPEHHALLARNLDRLGGLLRESGKFAEAESKYTEAIETLTKLIADYPDVPEHRSNLAAAYSHLALSLLAHGCRADAVDAFRRSVNCREQVAEMISNSDSRARLAVQRRMLASVLINLDRCREAIALLRPAIAVTPQDSETCNALAWALSIADDPALRNPTEAFPLAELAVRLSPQNGMFLTTLGAAQLAGGQTARAIMTLEKAAQTNHDNGDHNWLLMARAHVHLHQLDKARAAFDKAPEKQEDSELTKRLRADAAAAIRNP